MKKTRFLAGWMALLMLIGMCCSTGVVLAEEPVSYPTLLMNTPMVVNSKDDTVYLFVPEETGTYVIGSYDENGSDPRVTVYEGSVENPINEFDDDDGGVNYNFRLEMVMTAGVAYYVDPYVGGHNESFIMEIGLSTAAEGVVANEDTLEVYPTQHKRLYHRLTPIGAAAIPVTWSSADESIATVDGEGWVTGVAEGKTTVTVAIAGGGSDTVEVTVKPNPPVQWIQIEGDSYRPFYVGQTNQKMEVSFFPYYSLPLPHSWSSDAPDVVEVDPATGELTFKKAGSANISVTIDPSVEDDNLDETDRVATCWIRVKDMTTMSLNTPLTLTSNESYDNAMVAFTPSVSATYELSLLEMTNNQDTVFVNWYDPDFNLLIESDFVDTTNGNVARCRMEKDKTYYFETEAQLGDPTQYTLQLTQLPLPESVEMNMDEVSFYYVGDYVYPDATVSPEDSADEILWTIADESVAIFDEYGDVQMVGPGRTTLTVSGRDSGVSHSVEIVVLEQIDLPEDTVTQFDLTKENGMMHRFVITPEETGYYAVAAINQRDVWMSARLTDAETNEWNSLAEDETGTYVRKQILMGGRTYYLDIHTEEEAMAAAMFKEVPMVTKVEVTRNPDDMNYIEGVGRYRLSGLEIQVTFGDNTTYDWSYEEGGWVNGLEVDITKGKDPSNPQVTITVGDVSAVLPYNLVENPVERLELVKPVDHVYVENSGGSADTWYNPETEMLEDYYYYNIVDMYTARIRIVYKDGTSCEAGVYDEVNGYYVEYSDTQDERPWTVGGNNDILISYLGHTVEMPVTVMATPVKSIEIETQGILLYEHLGGYFESDDFFYYGYDLPEDGVLKVTYNDGTTAELDLVDTWMSSNDITYDDTQYDTPWVVGGEYLVTVTYMGATTTIPVKVVPNPVQKIELVGMPVTEYAYGDSVYGDMYADGEYYLYPDDLTGMELKVTYTDGTFEIFTPEDVDEDHEINGQPLWLNHDTLPVLPGDTIEVTMEYMGYSFPYEVTVGPSDVASLEMVTPPTQTEYVTGFYPVYTGAVFEITYTDGTTERVTVTDENTEYWVSPYTNLQTATLKVGDYQLMMQNDQMTEGEYFAHIGGVLYFFDCFTFTEKEVDSITVESFQWDGDSMTVTVTYKDGATDKLVLDLTAEDDMPYYRFYTARSDKGVMSVDVSALVEGGKVVEYEITLLEETVYIPAIVLGDVDGNGEVNAADALLALQIATDKVTPSDEQIAAANVDGKDGVAANDALLILQYATKKIAKF